MNIRGIKALSVIPGILLLLALLVPTGAFAADRYNCKPGASENATSSEAVISVRGEQFVDSSGRVVVLRGVNATGDAKVPPFKSITHAAQLDPLPGWGFNVVRLLFTWEAFEPQPCAYNDAYLEYYRRVIHWAADRGLYVIVDFHQDAFSRFSIDGCGEGFPAWAVHSSILRNTPDNDKSCAQWGLQMIADLSHHKSWFHFHRDSEGAKSRYIAMVATVADALASEANVIGYDIINEPWGTDRELYDLYEALAAAIREKDANAIIFEPPHALVSGISANNIQKPSYHNFAYAPHYYDGGVILLDIWFGGDPGKRLHQLRSKAIEWQVPMILTEFGAPGKTINVRDYIGKIYDWLDQNFVSGVHWNYTPGWTPELKDGWNDEDLSIVDDRGRLRNNYTPRPYPQVIAGSPIRYAVEEDGLDLQWLHNPELGATELFLPSGYLSGAELTFRLGNNQIAGTCSLNTYALQCHSEFAEVLTLSIRR